MPRPDRARLFTFYSYKGGVGRTMAVANVGCQLAKEYGRNVICVDWDLEAPGLHYYFDYTDKDLADRPGLLDYLEDFREQVALKSQGCVPELPKYLHALKPDLGQAVAPGSVRLMHCGRTNSEYMSRVAEFDWHELYEKSDGYRIIETLKQQLRQEAEMTLIDARAGQTDIGGVATIQVPDVVVILFTSNRQSLEGMERMARSFHQHPQRVAQSQPDPKTLIVPARVPYREDRFEHWMEEVVIPLYDRLVEEGILRQCDHPLGLWKYCLPVDSKAALSETLLILKRSALASDLLEPYARLSETLDNLYRSGRGEPLTEPHEMARLASRIKNAERQHDWEKVAALKLELAQHHVARDEVVEAERVFQSLLTSEKQFGRHRSPRGQCMVLNKLGQLYSRQGRWDKAVSHYGRALDIAREAGDAAWETAILCGIGDVRRGQHDWDEALRCYNRALRVPRGADDLYWQWYTLNRKGELYRQQGRNLDALALYDHALRYAQDAQNARGQGVVTMNMALVKWSTGHLSEAKSLFNRALEHAEAGGDAATAQDIREALSRLEAESRET